MLVTHGATDKPPWSRRQAHSCNSGAKLSVYDWVGHAPFWEDTARFNAELSAFVRAANKTN